ncbi:hypothetical protein BDM02DRAFT_3186261 [Thelephora ganbajun]|uniref:Uncharacterized protein n=1 Tax=Thelephora ganbajun TaxID=370292 RepID=A0ACB6ZIT4_THEGA|nr:hypothetical protein BDM02DRAFT_3186261 [Thelephora ganbajun]
MVASSLYVIGRMAGWYYIPDVVTRQLVNFSRRYIRNPPKPGTPAFSRHYRIAYATVVLGFLAYNLVEAHRAMPMNFYDVLDVHLDFTEEELNKANRAFARKNHPDRGGTEEVFIQGRLAYNVLKDPITRFAYDRFGPEIATWTNCKTRRDFLKHGLIQSAGYHIVTGVGLFIWSTISPSTVNFWRYILFLIGLLTELTLVVNPVPSLWSFLFPENVQYQHILFLHQLSIFFSVALSRVAPVVFPKAIEQDWDVRNWRTLLEQNDQIAKTLDSEVFSILHQNVRLLDPSFVPPTKPDQQLPPVSVEVMDFLTEEMENMIIEASLKKDQEKEPMKSLLNSAISRGRRSLHPSERPGWQQSKEYTESREKVEGWRLREIRSPALGLAGVTTVGLGGFLDEDELRLPSDPIEGEGSWLRQSTKMSNVYTRGPRWNAGGGFHKEMLPNRAETPLDKVWKGFVDEHHPEEVEESWETCSRAITDYDNHMARNWKEEIDTLLVFAGLFSAVTTAFIIDSYKWFRQGPTKASVQPLS